MRRPSYAPAPPVHLVLFSHIADTRAAGMGNWTHEMAAALRARGHRVSPWFADALPAWLKGGAAGVLLHPLAFALRAVRHRRDVDVFVVHEPSGFWYALLRRAWRALPPMIAMCHNVENRHVGVLDEAAGHGLAARRTLGGRLRYALGRAWQSCGAIRRADHVVVLSRVDREWVTARLGRAPGDVTLLLNGVAADADAGRGRPAPATVLMVGGWLDTKGRRAIPGMWRRVRERWPGARLTMAGTGAPAHDVLVDFAPTDRDGVRVLPRVDSRADMRALYAEHAVFAMPSLSEGSPLALLEAMQAGMAIVAASAGGIPDLVRDDVEALLYDPLQPADGVAALLRLLGDDALRRRLGDAARARAATLTWDAAARTLLEAASAARGQPVPAPTASHPAAALPLEDARR